MKLTPTSITTLSLTTITLLSGAILSSSLVFADDVVDEINITIPVSCTLSGTGMNSHNAEINNGQYNSAIGETTIKAFCNDNEGFAIYAIGYTDNEDGKNVLANSSLSSTYGIATGTATSGNTSNWAMKLSTITSPTPTYPIIIAGTSADTLKEQGDPDYTTFQEVPDDYAKVAYRTAGTDIGTNAEGSTLKTTYQAYISSTQPAGTYTGQVKYTMVHPSSAAPLSRGQVGVTYDANGSTFAGGGTTNEVVYTSSPMYIATTPLIAKSDNVGSDGTQNGSYTTGSSLTPVTATGASKMKVVIRYGLSSGTMLRVIEGEYDGQSAVGNYEMPQGSSTGTATYVFDGDAVTFDMNVYIEPTVTDGQDYGYYAEVYPVYLTEQSNTEASYEFATISVDSGTYAQTTDWYGSWYADINNQHYDFIDETDVKEFLIDNISTLGGTSIDIYRGLTFDEAYAKANKSQSGNYYIQQDLNKTICQTVAIGQNSTVMDIRDNNTYMIGRLKDRNCWMLDNLALDPTDSTTAANLNASNTNASTEAIYNYLNGGSTITGWSNTAVADVDTSFGNGGYTVPRINNSKKDTLVTSFGPASTNGQAKVGIYYNFCAVSVGTYCYGNYGYDDLMDIPNTLRDAPQDICPINWRLPTGGTDGEYGTLAKKYGTNATSSDSLQYNLSIPLSGYYNNSSSANYSGELYSSTYMNSGAMYFLYTNTTSIYVGGYNSLNRYIGRSVRCLVGN